MASEPGFVMQRAQPKAGPGIDPNRVKPEARQVRKPPKPLVTLDASHRVPEDYLTDDEKAELRGESSASARAYSLVLRDLYERVAKLQVAIAAIEALQ